MKSQLQRCVLIGWKRRNFPSGNFRILDFESLILDFLFEFSYTIYLASGRELPIDGESSKIAQSGCIHHCQKSQIETHAEISHGQIANQKSWNVHFASGSYQNNHNTSVSCWKQNIVKLVHCNNLYLVTLNLVTTSDLVTILQRPLFPFTGYLMAKWTK